MKKIISLLVFMAVLVFPALSEYVKIYALSDSEYEKVLSINNTYGSNNMIVCSYKDNNHNILKAVDYNSLFNPIYSDWLKILIPLKEDAIYNINMDESNIF